MTAAAIDSVRPGSLRAWVMACRPATLGASVVPVAAGSAVAHASGGFEPAPALAALAGAMLLQIGSNLANDVFDYEKGADTADRLGPVRTVQAGLLSPRAVRTGMALVFLAALGIGVYLTVVAGWAIIAIGLLSIVSAVAYTGGPYPLGYHGLGDVFVMIFFGFVAVAGTAYVQVGHVPQLSWWAGLAVGSLATNILVVNNLRDRETDAAAGKRTLAVRLGRRGALAQYYALLLVAYAVPIAFVVTGALGVAVLLPLVTAPFAVALARAVARERGSALNAVLVRTAKLMVLYGVSFAAGIALGAH